MRGDHISQSVSKSTSISAGRRLNAAAAKGGTAGGRAPASPCQKQPTWATALSSRISSCSRESRLPSPSGEINPTRKARCASKSWPETRPSVESHHAPVRATISGLRGPGRNSSPRLQDLFGEIPRMSVTCCGCSRSPTKPRLANTLPGSKGLAFVKDVAEVRTVFICDRAIIPDGNTVATAKSPGSLDAMDRATQSPTRNAKGAANRICWICRTAPKRTSHILMKLRKGAPGGAPFL